MGVNQKLIRAELYKLLIYDPGAFFLPHRDTLKAPGMFGTLVIVLPSDHTGGELVVTHGNRKVTLSLANNEVSAIHYAAFYADCEHEVKPILSGTRIALVYNLTKLVQFARLEGGYYTDEDREREDLKGQEMEELQKKSSCRCSGCRQDWRLTSHRKTRRGTDKNLRPPSCSPEAGVPLVTLLYPE